MTAKSEMLASRLDAPFKAVAQELWATCEAGRFSNDPSQPIRLTQSVAAQPAVIPSTKRDLSIMREFSNTVIEKRRALMRCKGIVVFAAVTLHKVRRLGAGSPSLRRLQSPPGGQLVTFKVTRRRRKQSHKDRRVPFCSLLGVDL